MIEPVATTTSFCIVILDDDPASRSLIRAILARTEDPAIRAATLLEAATLFDARALVDRHVVDVLLLDVHLPDGTGLDLAADLRRDHPDEADRPAILALTASVLPTDQQAAIDAGCNAFLPKPYAAQDLIRMIGRLLALRRVAMAGAASS
jgi:two-component system, OmpR family, KDP operon response regulator KdpE